MDGGPTSIWKVLINGGVPLKLTWSVWKEGDPLTDERGG